MLGGEHGGQQARSGRKAAGESGIKGERAGRCGAEGAADEARRDWELGTGRRGPRGTRGDGWSRPAPRCPLGPGSRACATCPAATRRGGRLRRASSADTASRGTGSSLRLSRERLGGGLLRQGDRVSSRYQRFGSEPAVPIPSSPLGSSNVGPKSLGPTTSNRRHRFGDGSVGAGVGEAHKAQLAQSSRLDSAPSGRRARWHKQPHAGWRLDQSVTSLREDRGRVGGIVVQIRRRTLGGA